MFVHAYIESTNTGVGAVCVGEKEKKKQCLSVASLRCQNRVVRDCADGTEWMREESHEEG